MRSFKIGLVVSVCVGYFAYLGAIAHAEEIFDSLQSTVINTQLWYPGINGNGISLVQNNAGLNISFASNASIASGTFYGGYTSLIKLTGDFDMQVDYKLNNWPYASGVRVGLHVIPSDNNARSMERTSFGSSNDFPGDPRDVYYADWNGVSGVFATTDLSGTLRWVRKSNQLTAYYLQSPNWIPVGTFTSSEDMKFGLAAWSDNSIFTGQSVSMTFDNFRVIQVPEPSTLVLLGISAINLLSCGWRRRIAK